MTTRAIGVRGPRRVLARLLETPHLAQVVQALEPKVLHQLVRTCGLEDCGEIVALATTEQLMRIFDDDLWRSDTPGEEERFDADRFGLWLEVLAEIGVALAAQKLVEMDFDFVTAALGRHILVLGPESSGFGGAADMGLDESDPAEKARAALVDSALEDGPVYEVGGYRVVGRRSESWDAVLSVLVTLEEDHRGFFSRLMRRCHRISTDYIEDNGGLYEVLTADEQIVSDVAGERERRREEQGYVAPCQAVAFLKLSRRTRGGGEGAPPDRDPVTAGYFREREARAKRGEGPGGRAPATRAEPRQDEATERHVAAFDSRVSRIRGHLLFVREHDAVVHAQRMEEIAYLANVLVAGCSFQSRCFRAVEAADAVLATCNLGLENWRHRPSALPPGFLLRQDLVTVFRRGWSVLHERVCLHVARRLAETLSNLTCDDDEVQDQLAELSRRLKAQVDAGTPWRERDNLDVIAILDQSSWATLLGLVDECPVLPRAAEKPADGSRPLRVASGFEFISANSQIARVHDFVESLPDRLL